ncbi:MAG: glycerol-3-phosphate dehydrogenase/oxidase [Bacteroidota bacterium]
MNVFASQERPQLLQTMQETQYDLIIIGGGATGAGTALDAAARGLSVCLIEMQDFAAGTSSRSTKLIHGGLRYLKQFEIALVREVGRERAIVHRLAPHLVVSEKMLLPLVEDGTYGRFATSRGLMVYDVLAGVERPDQRIMLSKEETLEKEDLLRTDILQGSGLYAEYRTDDARLTVEVLKTAAKYGAHCINYTKVTDFLYEDGKVVGVECEELLSGKTFDISAHQVVSAAGPWVDELREKNESLEGKRLHLTKGVHIVIPHEKLPLEQSVYFDVPDGRMLFAIPRGKITYVGTTDTDYHGNKENPRTNQEDVAYLITGTNEMFPTANLTNEDVISSWAGLRPLIHEDGKSASELSRKDEIFVSDSRLISIAGGKLTGYRKMAERVVDQVVKRLSRKLDRTFKPCTTDKIDIRGAEQLANAYEVEQYKSKVWERLEPLGFAQYDVWYLVHNYGEQTDDILADFFSGEDKSALGLIQAELRFGLQHEMVMTPVDFFSRRTGRLYFDIASVRTYAEPLMEQFVATFDWSAEEQEQHRGLLMQLVEEASTFPAAKPDEAVHSY